MFNLLVVRFLPIFTLFYSVMVEATVIEHLFTPQVTIVKPEMPKGVEIKTEQTNYSTSYDFSKETFLNLVIPFKVVSVYSNPVSYTLTMPTSHHTCINTSSGETTELKGLNFSLDGFNLDPELSGLPNSSGYTFTTSNQNNHELTISYPQIYRLKASQDCSGTIGIQAEVEI
ncbi:hypothetical protein E1100_00010 [Vibrio owensii]|uniref:hypothetical protein n=1 Tax=Vibrio owensii TaxID=696485 RepID=UPI0010488795|nr:hypothetical protein [Vibrio owensii]TDE25346.1 hypothetical protein E1100_00010 [Vibrio owensii]